MAVRTSPNVEEKTEVLYDPNEIVTRVVEQCSAVKNTVDSCIDADGLSILVIPSHPVTKAYTDMNNRGVRIRLISEITENNLKYCKELMKIAEIRHLDEVKGNFGVADGILYHGGATSAKSAPPPQLVTSTVKSFVEQQQYFFDMLWKKAIPAKQRIKEIEEHTKRQFIDSIQDSVEINHLVHKLIRSAKEEILILFPTTNTFYRYENEGLMKLIKNIGMRSGVKIRILIYLDNGNSKESIDRDYSREERIRVFMLQKSELQPKVVTMIIDNEYSLVIELEDDSALESTDAIRFATYSNSDSTVSTYLSIFETLWIQAELRNKERKIPSIN